MQFFFSFIFFIIGLLSSLFSPWLLFLSLIPFVYLFFYQKRKRAYLYFLFTFFGFLLIFLLPKGDINEKIIDGICIYRKENYCLILTLKGKYYVPDKEKQITLFSLVNLQGKTSEIILPHYESVFSFEAYLKTHGVFYQFNAKKISFYFHNPIQNEPLKSYILSFLEKKPAIFLSSLLMGDSLFELDENRILSELGILSTLSLSGFHISFFFHILESFFPSSKKKRCCIIEMSLLLFFLFLSNYRYSIRRIFLLKCLGLISIYTPWRIEKIERISLVAFTMLIFEPYSILSPSFYFPFPLLFALAFINLDKETNLKSKIKFVIFIMLFYYPIRAFQTPTINILSPLFQILFLPISHIIFCTGLLMVIIPPFGYLLNAPINLLLKLVSMLENNHLNIITGTPNIGYLILYYLVFFIFLFLLQYRFKAQLKYAYIAFGVLITASFIPDFIPHYEVTFIDVGQGDCTLIRNGASNILIDTGGSLEVDIAKECLIPYFYKKKITSLDAVIITHPDYDHNGALFSLSNSFPINNIYTASDFNRRKEQTISFSSLDITNLNTYLIPGDSSDNNYNSGVYRFTISSKTFLIMGDAPKEIENKLIENKKSIDCDVLKIGHHGSNTSSSEKFLIACSPSLAIISCGEKNRYGHPHKDVLNTLNSLSIPYRRTDLEGSITCYC